MTDRHPYDDVTDIELARLDGLAPVITQVAEPTEVVETIPVGEEWDDDDIPIALAGKKIMTPITWVLLMLLCLGGGFALGVRAEKQHATSVAQSVIAADLAQARTRTTGATGAGGFGRTGTAAGGAAGAATTSSTGPAAAGTIQLIDGRKVYVLDAQGNVAIAVAPASLDISALAAGQTVTVAGTINADGTIAASSITPTAGATATSTSVSGTPTPAPTIAPASSAP